MREGVVSMKLYLLLCRNTSGKYAFDFSMESRTHSAGGWQWRPMGRRPTNQPSRLVSPRSGLLLIVSCASLPLLDPPRFTYLPYPSSTSPRTVTKNSPNSISPDILHNSWKLSRRLFDYAYLLSNSEASIFFLSLPYIRFYTFTLSTLPTLHLSSEQLKTFQYSRYLEW